MDDLGSSELARVLGDARGTSLKGGEGRKEKGLDGRERVGEGKGREGKGRGVKGREEKGLEGKGRGRGMGKASCCGTTVTASWSFSASSNSTLSKEVTYMNKSCIHKSYIYAHIE